MEMKFSLDSQGDVHRRLLHATLLRRRIHGARDLVSGIEPRVAARVLWPCAGPCRSRQTSPPGITPTVVGVIEAAVLEILEEEVVLGELVLVQALGFRAVAVVVRSRVRKVSALMGPIALRERALWYFTSTPMRRLAIFWQWRSLPLPPPRMSSAAR